MEKLYHIKKEEIPQSAQVLKDAFTDDELISKILEDATPKQQLAFYEGSVRYAYKYGEVLAPSNDIPAVMLVLPGRFANMSAWRAFFSGAMKSVFIMGSQMTHTTSAIIDAFEIIRNKTISKENYIYLNMIGVITKQQGKDYGSRLLHTLIEESDKSGLPIYLETETNRNIKIFKGFGFEVMEQTSIVNSNILLRGMLRKPISK